MGNASSSAARAQLGRGTMVKNRNHSGGLRDFKLNFRNQGGGCADLISNAPSLTVLKYYTNARARAPWARLMLSAALKRAAASRSAHGVHTQHTREGFKETHSHTSSCSAYMSRGASSAAMDTEQRAGETDSAKRARAGARFRSIFCINT